MSYTIKSEDVPASLIESLNACEGGDFMDAGQIAAIVESAIEAGLVSPPCHVLTRDSGYVIDHGYDGAIRVWPGKGHGANVEHYRGQQA